MHAVEVLVPVAFFAAIFAIVYVAVTARNKERLALIEKGADASLFKTNKKSYFAITLGMMFVGVALGLLIGNALDRAQALDAPVAYFSMIFLGGGTGLISSHFLVRKLREKDEKKELNE